MRTLRKLSANYRCVDGRMMRHDPQPDDPNLETDVGECTVCDGTGQVYCDDHDDMEPCRNTRPPA